MNPEDATQLDEETLATWRKRAWEIGTGAIQADKHAFAASAQVELLIDEVEYLRRREGMWGKLVDLSRRVGYAEAIQAAVKEMRIQQNRAREFGFSTRAAFNTAMDAIRALRPFEPQCKCGKVLASYIEAGCPVHDKEEAP